MLHTYNSHYELEYKGNWLKIRYLKYTTIITLLVTHMIIQHNLPALFASNQLNKNSTASQKSLEKLSSGLRINKASDDAAGLSISQKMKAQIRGLEQAQRNVQDGLSLLQVAQGGIYSILEPPLQRMRELLLEAANDTLTSEDRQMIQTEIEQIKQDIDNIANNCNFNTMKLLDGTHCGSTYLISPATISSVGGWCGYPNNVNGYTTINAGSNDTVVFEIDDVQKTIVLDAGTYSITNLVSEINSKLSATSAGITASVSYGRLSLTHNTAGAHSIRILSGNAINTILVSTQDGYLSGGVIANGLPTLNPSVTITAGVNDTLTFDVDSTSYSITIPPGTYPVDWDNTTSLLRDAINNELLNAGAPVTARFIYYKYSPPDGAGLRFEARQNGPYLLSAGSHTLGNFGGNAKATLFDMMEVVPFNFQDSSVTKSGVVVAHAAQIVGNSDLSSGLLIEAGTNDTLNIEVDGVSKSIVLPPENYSSNELLNEINNQLSTNAADVTASYDNDRLVLTHNIPGTGHSIRILSGNAINALFLDSHPGYDAVYGTNEPIKIQVGSNGGDSFFITFGDMRIENLGIKNVSVEYAQTGLELVDNAIQCITSELSKVGAYQNALEHINNNLANYQINLTAADSRIEDADIAKEVMGFVKEGILISASQSILAQANQQPQSVLSLIKSS